LDFKRLDIGKSTGKKSTLKKKYGKKELIICGGATGSDIVRMLDQK
jgi:uncharacterized protein with ACT and thioredoxin-like domain